MYNRIVISLCTIVLATLVTTTEVKARSIGGMMESIEQGASQMVDSLDVNKLVVQPQRDLLTLAMGGVIGFALGGIFTNLGIVNVQILGVSIIPIASGVAGFYLANEGYFDNAKETIAPSTPPAKL